jgi:glucose-1-phosphate adenylyltransferase
MAVSASGQIMLSSTVKLREPTLVSSRNLRLVKFCNGEMMGRKIELHVGGSNGCIKNVTRKNISMSLTADVATESKVYLN